MPINKMKEDDWAAGWDVSRAVEHVRATVTEALAGIHVPEEHSDHGVRFIFPTVPDSQYRFEACVYTDLHNLQIHARPVDPDATDVNYFWYEPLEDWRFESFEEMLSHFEANLVAVLTHESRIRQRKKLLLWHFILEYCIGGEWREIYGAAAFRWGGFNVPAIEGRERIYRAHAIRTTE